MKAATPIDPKFVSLHWAGPERAAEIAAIHKELFEAPWEEAAIRSLLDHPGATALVAMFGTTRVPVGFIIGQLAADEAEILSIGVAQAWQRRGLGRRLVDGLIRAVALAEGKSLHLEVAEDNDAARALYRRAGFKEAGRRRGYYVRDSGPAVDALRLEFRI
jgi:ribosomal-protein-alanine N-acetyltransferase